MPQNQLFEATRLSLKKARTSAFDKDIERLIDTAKADLAAAGVVNITDDDPLIQQACILYAHAHFGECDNPERYESLFNGLRDRLSLMPKYTSPAGSGGAL